MKLLPHMKNFLSISSLVFLLTLFIVGRNLDKPFFGIHDWNGARYGNIARNFLRYGLLKTHFGQVENSGEVKPLEFQYYTHFPPLLPIVISISYKFLGVKEWATRLIPLLATAGTIVLLFLIGRTIFNWQVGLTASLLALATPMVRYFGKNPVHEPLAVFFAALAFFGCSQVLTRKESGWLLIYLGVALASLTNWSGVFLSLVISLILARRVGLRKIVFIWSIPVIIALIFFGHVYLLTGSFWGGGLKEALLQRTSIGGQASLTPFSFWQFLDRLRLWSSTLFTISLIASAALGALFLFRKGNMVQKRLAVGIFIYSALYSLVFPNATFIHSYFIFSLLLPLALLASFAISQPTNKNFLKFTLLAILFLAIWFERADYLKALETSAGDKLAVDIGRKINKEIPTQDTIFVTPFDFAASRTPQLAFYSDRKIVLKPNSGYNWIVEVDQSRESFEILRRQR